MYTGEVVDDFQTASGSGPFGHLDLVGNVWEWVWDWYDPRAYERSGAEADPLLTDPSGPEEAVPDQYGTVNRTVRGCAWNCSASELRLTNRGRFQPQEASYSIGLRLVRDTADIPESSENPEVSE